MEQIAEGVVRVAIAAQPGSSLLARDTLARVLGIGAAQADLALSQGHTVLQGGQTSKSALTLLRVLGIETNLLSQASEARFDLSLRQIGRPSEALHTLFDDLKVEDLHGASGMVVQDLPQGAAEALAQKLRRIPGVSVTLAPRLGALYDLFAPQAGHYDAPADLRRYLSILGFSQTAPVVAMGEALAVNLDAGTAGLVQARFGHLGIVVVNQAFQRFDLRVTDQGDLTRREFGDFLAARGIWLAAGQTIGKEGLRVEQGLPRALARQFLNDYRLIGLSARLELCRSSAP